jgi:hypothetical protein
MILSIFIVDKFKKMIKIMINYDIQYIESPEINLLRTVYPGVIILPSVRYENKQVEINGHAHNIPYIVSLMYHNYDGFEDDGSVAISVTFVDGPFIKVSECENGKCIIIKQVDNDRYYLIVNNPIVKKIFG